MIKARCDCKSTPLNDDEVKDDKCLRCGYYVYWQNDKKPKGDEIITFPYIEPQNLFKECE